MEGSRGAGYQERCLRELYPRGLSQSSPPTLRGYNSQPSEPEPYPLKQPAWTRWLHTPVPAYQTPLSWNMYHTVSLSISLGMMHLRSRNFGGDLHPLCCHILCIHLGHSVFMFIISLLFSFKKILWLCDWGKTAQSARCLLEAWGPVLVSVCCVVLSCFALDRTSLCSPD